MLDGRYASVLMLVVAVVVAPALACTANVAAGFLTRVAVQGGVNCTQASCTGTRWTIPCFVDFGAACDEVCDFKQDTLDFTEGFAIPSTAHITLTLDPRDDAASGKLVASGGSATLGGKIILEMLDGVPGTPGDYKYAFAVLEGAERQGNSKFSVVSSPHWPTAMECRETGVGATTASADGQFLTYSIKDTCVNNGASALASLTSMLGAVAGLLLLLV